MDFGEINNNKMCRFLFLSVIGTDPIPRVFICGL